MPRQNNFWFFITKTNVKAFAKFNKVPAIAPVENGCVIGYPCGTTRFIANSWYVDIDTNQL